MKKIISACFVFAGLATITCAGIGEDEAAISARYGKSIGDIPTEGFGIMRGFMSAGYIVGVKLVNGVSEMEMFSKADESDMSASQIESLLKGNGAGEWKAEQTGKPKWRRWHREDRAMVALYDTMRHFLYISSRKFYDEQAKKIEETPKTPSA
jgi:hypothetical protein